MHGKKTKSPERQKKQWPCLRALYTPLSHEAFKISGEIVRKGKEKEGESKNKKQWERQERSRRCRTTRSSWQGRIRNLRSLTGFSFSFPLAILPHPSSQTSRENENVKKYSKKVVFTRHKLCQLVKFLDAKNTSFTVTYLAKTSEKEGFTLSMNSQNPEIISSTDLFFQFFSE